MPAALEVLPDQPEPAERIQQRDAPDHRRQHQRQQDERPGQSHQPRQSLRASTSAIGTPSSRHSAVLAAAVLRLSTSAVVDDSLVISDQKCGQSTLRGDRDQRHHDEQRPDRRQGA